MDKKIARMQISWEIPSKREIMELMENRLPGETLAPRDPSVQPPVYPELGGVSKAIQQPQPPQQLLQSQPAQMYTIQQQPMSVQSTQFGKQSQLAYCPSCHATQMTRLEHESSMMTHIIAAVLCFTTCCCCLPYCFDACKSARHYCSNCGSYLGAYNN